jgi:hypothetical protein
MLVHVIYFALGVICGAAGMALLVAYATDDVMRGMWR